MKQIIILLFLSINLMAEPDTSLMFDDYTLELFQCYDTPTHYQCEVLDTLTTVDRGLYTVEYTNLYIQSNQIHLVYEVYSDYDTLGYFREIDDNWYEFKPN